MVTLVAAVATLGAVIPACGGGSTPDATRDPTTTKAVPATRPDVPAPDALGSFEVGHTSFTATDAARAGRTLPLDVWYPVDPGTAGNAAVTELPLAPGINLRSDVAKENPPVSKRDGRPLVVFSHGYGGINTQSANLMETLASHGFVVVAPEHVGNSQGSPGDSFDVAASRRVPDVSFVIDTMIKRSRDPADVFAGRLDEKRVGVVGHSFGAMTAIGTAAGWAGTGPDARVAAIVAISAVIDPKMQSTARSGPNAGFTAAQLAKVRIPVMLMGGTRDTDVLIANNDLAFDELSRVPVADEVSIKGATHTHFANVCSIGKLLVGLGIGEDRWPAVGAADLVEPYATTCGPDAFPIAEAIRLQNLYVVAFLQRYLVGDERYGWFLTETYAGNEPAITLRSRS